MESLSQHESRVAVFSLDRTVKITASLEVARVNMFLVEHVEFILQFRVKYLFGD